MKTKHGLGLGLVVAMFSATAWIGCGDDTVGNPPGGGGNDGGTPDATMPTPEAGLMPDTGAATPEAGSTPDTGTVDAGPKAGDAGDAGDPCQTYCTDVMSACGTTAPFAQYQSMTECLFTCSVLQTASTDQQMLTEVGTIACRDEHALNALDAGVVSAGGTGQGLGENPHCWHAGPYGGSVCGDPCTSFCYLDTLFCSTAYGYDGGVPYADIASCITKCETYPMIDSASAGWDNDGGFSAFSGATGTFDCREYHLLNAMASGAGSAAQSVHCPHTSSNNAVCGDNDVDAGTASDAGDAGTVTDAGNVTDGSDASP
jgi:hypothetical protein